MADDSHVSDDEYCQRVQATDNSDKSTQPLPLGNRCIEVDVNTTSSFDHGELMEQVQLTNRVEVDEIDQPSLLVDSIAGHSEMNACCDQEHDKVLLLSSLSNTVADSDLSATVASTRISRSSPDSGVYSKAVSNSIFASQPTVTESADIMTGLFKSSEDRKAVSKVSDARTDDDISSGGTEKGDQLLETLALTVVERSTSVSDDDDKNTVADVRSSIMSAGTDDTVNQTIVETENEMPSEAMQTAAAAAATCSNVCVPSDQLQHQHMSCLGSQETSSFSDSDADDDAVLKTVVAIRTKAVDRAGCLDSMNLFEPHDTADIVNVQNDDKGINSSPVVICDEFAGERLLHGDADIDSSRTACSHLQTVDHDTMEKNLQEEIGGTDMEASVAVDGRNVETPAVETCPGTNELLSTLSTELDQYMIDHHGSQVTGTSQTLGTAADDSAQLPGLMATVKMFSEDEDLIVDSAGRRSHACTGSFIIDSHNSLPLFTSNSVEVPGTEEMRRYSLQPQDVVKQLGDLSLEEQVHENWQNGTKTLALTASMEDLKLRPSRKKLEFDSLPAASSQLVYLDPPDEYRDSEMSAENSKSSMSPSGCDLAVTDARWPTVDLNMQAKQYHLERYLKSLASLPGCDTTHDGLNNLQNSHAYSHDVSDSFNFDGENGVEHPWHEHSTSVLIPDALHRSADTAEDDYLEAQLHQYEVMKQRLMEEHRRSLERLLAEQEQQMLLLRSHLMGEVRVSGSSSHTGSVAHKPSVAVTSASDVDQYSSKLSLFADVHGAFSSQSLTNKVTCPNHSRLDQVQQNVSSGDAPVTASVDESGHKVRSLAGVFYNDQQVISREPSCSTIRSGDTESEFAYKSPAVLRSSRRVTPTCSPRDSGRTSLHQSMMTAQDIIHHHHHHLSSSGADDAVVHSHRLNRRHVDVFAEASMQVSNA